MRDALARAYAQLTRKTLLCLIAIGIWSLVLITLARPSEPEDYSGEIQELGYRLEELTSTLRELESDVSSIESDVNMLTWR
jgi:hypothetical protein